MMMMMIIIRSRRLTVNACLTLFNDVNVGDSDPCLNQPINNDNIDVDVEVFAIALLLKCLSVLFGSKKVFSVRVNCSGLSDIFRMSGGSLFHWFGPDTEKPRQPNLSVLARGTSSPYIVRTVSTATGADYGKSVKQKQFIKDGCTTCWWWTGCSSGRSYNRATAEGRVTTRGS